MKRAGAWGAEKCPAGLGFPWKNSSLAGLLQAARWAEETSGRPQVSCWGLPEGFSPAAWRVPGEEAEDLSGPAEAFLPVLGFVFALQAALAKAVVVPCSPQPGPFLCD